MNNTPSQSSKSQSSKYQLLIDWNNTQVNYPQNVCIHQLFEEQANKTPEAIAVIFEDQTLTYQQLNEKANQLAHYLRKLGVKPEVLVGISVERSPEMMIGLLGILKAGGAYVPIDSTYPHDRISYMIEDSQVNILLTQNHLKELFTNYQGNLIFLDTNWQNIEQETKDNPVNETTANNLIYVIYTSGSTGKPKGTMNIHCGVVNRLLWMQDEYKLTQNDRVLQKTPFSFDVSGWEFWWTLITGASLIFAKPEGHKDSAYLAQIIKEKQITTLHFVPSMLQIFLEESNIEECTSLRLVFCSGEALPISLQKRFFERLKAKLHNLYGPTEAAIDVTYWECDPNTNLSTVPIGKPVANTQTYILDASLNPVQIGEIGELYLGGIQLARGYLNRPELTAEKFINNPFIADFQSPKLYKTGDLARYLPDGNIEYLGRLDNQVKIRGNRIELGEIEYVLNEFSTIKESVVLAREDSPGDQRLVAYLVTNDHQELNISELRHYLQDKLPDYMIPAIFMGIEKMPLSPNGKIDRKLLPKPDQHRPELANIYVAPQSELESILVEIWTALLKVDQVGIEDNFFDLGGHSLLVVQVVNQLKESLNLELSITKLFQYPTIKDLANYIKQNSDQSLEIYQNIQARFSQKKQPSHDIAIIGMSGRFPGANNVEKLWENLCNNVASITFFKDEELDPFIDSKLKNNPQYVKAKGIIEKADYFDANFFSISPLEAQLMEPQHRIFLEIAYSALENSGYSPDQYQGLIGLFAGAGYNTYLTTNVAGNKDLINRLGEFQTMLGNDKDFLPTRVSYKLNLKGPSVNINTACSTSLVTVIHGVNSLRNHECDIALAGGISITTPLNSGYLYQEGGMLSPDGHCRPFDANAQGTTFNSGAGIVVLKRLEDALKDGDRICAVIKGVGINNDGGNKVSFTAPSVDGQSQAIMSAHADAKINPETISYLETHGTATPLGDPIEIEALTQAFNQKTTKTGFCAIGSIKSNIGHLVAAAGVTGLIKTALALKNQKIPATLHFKTPNPVIDFEKTPFYVNAQLTEWKRDNTPRRAGVSSFGVGGTNAHVILEEAPPISPSSSSRPHQLLLISAKTPSALDTATQNLTEYLKSNSEFNLADGAYTLQVGRQALPHRRFIVCQDTEEAITNLTKLPPNKTATRQHKNKTRELIFMFPGQGSQYVNMGLNLYNSEPLFKKIIDQCAEILTPYLGEDLRHFLYPNAGDEEKAELSLKETRITQPAIFTLEYALAKLWMSWGIKPNGAIGHSIGEFVAACLAGVFSLEDALKLVAIRGKLMQDLPRGSMLSVRSNAQQVEQWLNTELTTEKQELCAIATINSPSLCVVSGPTEYILEFQTNLENKGIICKFLHTSHAFHSPMMTPILEPFGEIVKTIKLSEHQFPIMSTVTAEWLTPQQAKDHQYWTNHLRATVRFADGIKNLWQKPERVLLEIGPRNTTATLARQQAQSPQDQVAISSLGSTSENEGEWIALLQAIGQLYLTGITINWQKFYILEKRHRIPLPTYPFEGKRFWVESVPSEQLPVTSEQSTVNSEESSSFVVQSLYSENSPLIPQHSSLIMPEPRQQRLIPILKEVLENTSGFELNDTDQDTTFLEIGLDSLALTQVALDLKNKFKVNITFRQLMEDYPNLVTLSEFLDQKLPPDAFPAPVMETPVTTPVTETAQVVPNPQVAQSFQAPQLSPLPTYSLTSTPSENMNANQALVAQQLQIMARQLELLGGGVSPLPQTPPSPPLVSGGTSATIQAPPPPTVENKQNLETEEFDLKKTRGPGTKITKKAINTDLTSEQKAFIEQLIQKYIAKSPESKRQTQEHRKYLADPRTVSGFTPLFKEMVYPIVVERSFGSKLWDVDGNEYIDITNGFGMNFFGWSPPFVTEAVKAQLDKGVEIGPQTPLAGKVAKLFTEFTGLERVAFCNTGSEAVMAAMRLSRTITGRKTIVTFSGDYHGTFDEVLVRSGPNLRSFPIAPGILPSMFENILVLEYGTDATLELIRSRADDIAGVLIEPVRSRYPDQQPKEFLQELRRITEKSETAFIMDEVVTGFRCHPRGAQGYFGLEADLATYGKVVGGGLPIGLVAGKAKFMDALDGGYWEFGDDSVPEVGVTFFAGTFVRHPMVLAAAEAVLIKLKAEGPPLQENLNQKVDAIVTDLNQYFEQGGVPLKIAHFSSFFYINYSTEDAPYGSLLFYLLREKGIHIWEHRPCVFTLAHSDADFKKIVWAFKESVAEMQIVGLLPNSVGIEAIKRNRCPHPEARLGKDQDGNPAWFIPDPDRPGKYLQLNISH